MIVTVTLNPAIDVAYQIDGFEADKGHRVEAGNKTAGGKGLNVARVLKEIGADVLCTGFLGGNNGEWVKQQLRKEEIAENFVAIDGETRTCLAILDKAQNTQTEILEKGPEISEEEQWLFNEAFQEILSEATMVVASGSLPRGLRTDFYKQLSESAKAAGVPFILDTSGEALQEGIGGKPLLIKPNEEELAQYAKRESLTLEESVIVAKEICDSGVQMVLVSLGEAGALLVTGEQVLMAEIPSIDIVNAVGSGDSTVAGMASALTQDLPLSDCLKWACACGMANALEAKTGMVDMENVKHFFSQINIKRL